MTALILNTFQGIAPRFADRLLSAEQGSFVANLKPTNGDMRGFRSLDHTASFPAGSWRRAIKFYYPNSDDFEWFLSTDVNADAVQNPLANDAFDRVYYTEASQPNLRVTTLADLGSGTASVAAGVPRPTAAPTVAPPPGGTSEARAYVYTFQTIYGSESAPSPPTIDTGNSSGTWTISGFSASPGSAVTTINIYRSASGEQSSGQYYKVGSITIGTASFSDSMANDAVPLQPPMTSTYYDPPVDGITGLCVHSSGAVAAFKLRTVYFSEPYLPHAWPAAYAYTVDSEIVGIAPILNFIVVLTKGKPTILQGSHPSTMSLVRLPDAEPCTSKRSIVVMSNACLFASTNGICAISSAGLSRPTNELMTQEEFAAYDPENIVAASYGSYYVAFYNDSNGFVVALPPYEPTNFVPLNRYAGVTGLDSDSRTNDLYVIRADNAFRFDAVGDSRFAVTFRSKEFINAKPINFGAVQIIFDTEVDVDALARILAAAAAYNAARFAEGELDTLGAYPVADSIDHTYGTLDPILGGLPPIQPLGGEPLYDPAALAGAQVVHFTLIGDGVVRANKTLTDQKTHKLPEGYKATRWFIELNSSVSVQRCIVAETARECKVA